MRDAELRASRVPRGLFDRHLHERLIARARGVLARLHVEAPQLELERNEIGSIVGVSSAPSRSSRLRRGTGYAATLSTSTCSAVAMYKVTDEGGSLLRRSLFAVALPLALVASPARAQSARLVPEPTGLDYTRANTCPEEQFFRDLVASHLGGRDPFVPTAPRRVSLTLRRVGRGFGATLVMYDDTGKRLGSSPEMIEPDCTRAIETASTVVTPWLLPLVIPRAAPPPPAPPIDAPPSPEPPSTPAMPVRAAEPSEPVAPAPVVAPKPSVFEGKAGLGRAILYAFTAAGVATGTGFAVAARSKVDEARQLAGALQQKAGAGACNHSAPALAGDCQRTVELHQQHDNYAVLATGFFAAAGLMGAATTASIWIIRTPATPAVRVKPSAPGSLAGLTFQGSW